MRFYLIQALSEDTTQLFGPYATLKFAETEVEQIKKLTAYDGFTFHILGHVPGETPDGYAPLYPAWSDDSLDLDISYVKKAKKRAEKEDGALLLHGKRERNDGEENQQETRTVPVPVAKKIKRTRQPSNYNMYVGIRIKVLVIENQDMSRKMAFQQAAKDWSSIKQSYENGKIPHERALELIQEQTKRFEDLSGGAPQNIKNDD